MYLVSYVSRNIAPILLEPFYLVRVSVIRLERASSFSFSDQFFHLLFVKQDRKRASQSQYLVIFIGLLEELRSIKIVTFRQQGTEEGS